MAEATESFMIVESTKGGFTGKFQCVRRKMSVMKGCMGEKREMGRWKGGGEVKRSDDEGVLLPVF